MDASILMTEGLTLMGFGMGFVFVFLTLLVIATKIMSWIINRYESNIDFPAPTSVAAPVATPVKDESLIAVLTAAVHKHRSRRKN